MNPEFPQAEDHEFLIMYDSWSTATTKTAWFKTSPQSSKTTYVAGL